MQYTLKMTNKGKAESEYQYSILGDVKGTCLLEFGESTYPEVHVNRTNSSYIMKQDEGAEPLTCWINCMNYTSALRTQLSYCVSYGHIHVSYIDLKNKVTTQFYELVKADGEHYVLYPSSTDVRKQSLLRIYKQIDIESQELVGCVIDYVSGLSRKRTYSGKVQSFNLLEVTLLLMFYEQLRSSKKTDYKVYRDNLENTLKVYGFDYMHPEDLAALSVENESVLSL